MFICSSLLFGETIPVLLSLGNIGKCVQPTASPIFTETPGRCWRNRRPRSWCIRWQFSTVFAGWNKMSLTLLAGNGLECFSLGMKSNNKMHENNLIPMGEICVWVIIHCLIHWFKRPGGYVVLLIQTDQECSYFLGLVSQVSSLPHQALKVRTVHILVKLPGALLWPKSQSTTKCMK